MNESHESIEAIPLRCWMTQRIAEQLNVEEQAIDTSADFMSLGLDSITLMGMVGELSDILGEELSVDDLWTCNSVDALVKLVENRRLFPDLNEQIRVASNIPNVASQLGEATRWNTITALQSHGDLQPIYFIHGISGDVTCYRHLVEKLGDDQPAFGLRQSAEPTETIEQMAATLIDGLKTIQHKGPYRLVGYCFGGTVAFEMARQLKQEGVTCSVVMIDPLISPSAVPNYSTRLRIVDACRHRIRLCIFIMRGVIARKPDLSDRLCRRSKRWVHRILHAVGLTQQTIDDQTVKEMFSNPSETYRKNVSALRKYRPHVYPGQVVILQSDEFFYTHSTQPTLWRCLAGGGVEVRRICGDHDQVLLPSAVEILAQSLISSEPA